MQSPSTGAGVAERLPVWILSGFLGSGKTTLLNKLLRRPAWADSAVVVNEFGDIGLDHLLVAGARDNVVLLDGGCLCCTVLDSLGETLADLYRRRASGEAPPFRRVIVETSGLAEPGPIVRTLMRDPVASHFFRLGSLACAVDARFGAQTLAEHHEAAAQAAMADRLVITKTDLTGGRCPADLAESLASLNPTATRLVAHDAPIDRLLDEAATAASPHLHAAEDAHAHRHTTGIGSVSLRIAGPIGWQGLATWLDQLRSGALGEVLRCKGVLEIAGLETPVILQGVQTIFDTTRAPRWPDDQRGSRIVVIGRDLPADALRRSVTTLKDL